MAGVDLGVLDRELFLRFLVAGFLLGVGRVVRRGRRRPLERVLEDSYRAVSKLVGQIARRRWPTLRPLGIVARGRVWRRIGVGDGSHDAACLVGAGWLLMWTVVAVAGNKVAGSQSHERYGRAKVYCREKSAKT